ncbi:hypothetical protein CEJ83_19950, partial [Acinetobacter baumannii]
PGLFYWWMIQKWFPYSSIMERHPILFNKRDVETIKQMSRVLNPNEHNMRLQGAHESLHRDIMVHLGTWEFDPMEMENQFPNNEESVFFMSRSQRQARAISPLPC